MHRVEFSKKEYMNTKDTDGSYTWANRDFFRGSR